MIIESLLKKSLPKTIPAQYKNLNAVPISAFTNTSFAGKSPLNIPEIDEFLNKTISLSGHYKAKMKCVGALIGPESRETVCIVDKATGQILSTQVGTAEACAVDLNIIGAKGRDLILYHGHPKINGITLPISLQDFLVLNDSNIDKIVAFNLHGKQSFLKKGANFEPLNETQIAELRKKYTEAFLKTSDKSKSQKIIELMEYVKAHPKASGVKMEITERLNALQRDDTAPEIINNFWAQNASKHNLIYFSEF